MLLPDINVWLALSFESHVCHKSAKAWIDSVGNDEIAFCRQTQQGYLRLASNPKALGKDAVTMEKAWNLYERILSDPRITLLPEPVDIESKWKRLTARRSRSPKLWNDAWIGAFAIVEQARLITFDKAFRQFEGLNYLILSQ